MAVKKSGETSKNSKKRVAATSATEQQLTSRRLNHRIELSS